MRKPPRLLPTSAAAAVLRRRSLSLLLLLFLPLLLFSTFIVLSPRSPPPSHLALLCRATRFPSLCLSLYPSPPSPLSLILSSLSTSLSSLRSISPLFSPYPTCQSHLSLSFHRLTSAISFLSQNPNPDFLSSRAYLSAALHYQYDCFNFLSNLNKSSFNPINPPLFISLTHLSSLTSNSLSLLFSYLRFGNNFSLYSPPLTERQGLFETPLKLKSKFTHIKSSPHNSFFPKVIKPNITVCKIGSCDHTTVQDAVFAAPTFSSARFVIHIRAGVYRETVRIPYEKTYLVFIGDGKGITIISYNLNAKMPNITTFDTATVAVTGDGFRAYNLTFENSAGAGAYQAVAFRSDSDRSVLVSVEFKGHQDTLYARTMRQFYDNCQIKGTIDFIFGNAAALFDNCLIEVVPRLENPNKGRRNPVTAHGRTDPAQVTGFVFHNCTINGSTKYLNLYKKNRSVHQVYLGRPWKEYARTVFIGCNLGEMVSVEGWLPWRGEFALNTLYYGEYDSWGPGAVTSGRVDWSSIVPKEQLIVYSAENFIQLHEWIAY